ncbi:MAG: hypothetical protein WC595_05885, partial [Candidatus Nanoarchaeia archaeon]
SDQYKEEQPKVINAAIYEGTDPAEDVLSFTEDYLQYARQREPTFGILYVYKDDQGNVHLVNTLNNAVLNIEFTDPVTGRDSEILLVCDQGPDCETTGTIRLNIAGWISSTTVRAPSASYGGDFSNVKTLEGITTLRIIYPDMSRENIDLSNFKTATRQMARDSDSGLVRVSVTDN